MSRIVPVLASSALLVVALSFCGSLDPRFDLLAHFRVVIALAVGALAILSFLLRRRRSASAFLVAGVVDAIPIVLLAVPSHVPQSGPLGAELTVMLFNAQVENPRKDEVARFIASEQPDLVVIQEATDDLCDRIDGTGAYQTVIAELRQGEAAKRSSALHRRLAAGIEVESAKTLRPDDSGYALAILEARLRRGDDVFTVFVPRLPPPVTADRRAVRDRMFEELSKCIAARTAPALVVADLNTTPFASDFRAFLDRTSLRDAGAGRGHAATWPALGPFSWLGLSLDHVLHTPEFESLARRVHDDALGSDHFPVMVTLRLRSTVARSEGR